MMKFARAFILPVFACAILHTKAQHYNFINYNNFHGLPSTESYQVIQDRKGYLWIPTDAGVARFNGNTFRVFTKEDGLPDNTVFKVYEDKWDRIWFLTAAGELAYFRNDSIYQPACNPELRKWMMNGKALFVSFTVTEDAVIHFFGTYNVSGMILPGNNYSKVDSLECLDDQSTNVVQVREGELFCYSCRLMKKTTNRVFIRTPDPDTAVNLDSLHSRKLKFPSSTLLKAVRLGPYVYYATNNLLYRISSKEKKLVKEFGHGIIALYADPTGRLWVGVLNGGTFLFKDPASGREPEHLLETYSVTGILMDHEQGLWFSTREKGLFYLRSLQAMMIDRTEGLKPDPIRSLFAFDSSVVINYQSYLYAAEVRPVNGRFILVPDYKVNGADVHNRAIRLGDKLIFLNEDIEIRNGSGKLLKKTEVKISKKFTDAVVINDTTLMAANFGAVILFSTNRLLGEASPPARVTSILLSPQGKMLATTNKGVWEFRTDTFVAFLPDVPELSGRIYRAVNGPRDNMFFLTSDHGIVSVEEEGVVRTVVPLTWMGKRIPRDLCFLSDTAALLTTNEGCFYMAFRDKEARLRKLGLFTDFPSREISSIVRHHGHIFMATKEGIIILAEKDIYDINEKPEINIEHIYNQQVAIAKTDPATLIPYSGNRLRITFNGISFSSMGKVRYRYILEGLDRAWTESHTNELVYSNLPPGNYRFRIMALDLADNKSEEKSFSFTILTPFYRSTWFYAALVLTAVGLSMLITRSIILRIKKKEETKTALNKLMAEYQLSALKAQMNPHFIFNCINSIQHLILTGKNEEAYTYLNKFSTLVRMILDHSKDDLIRLEDELILLNAYLELEKLRAEDGFVFTIGEKPEQAETLLVPTMVFQPFAENALWHGLLPSEKEKQLTIIFEKRGKRLVVLISDNGIGREQALRTGTRKKMSSIGIRNITNRVNLINRKLNLDIKFEISDLYDPGGAAAGTMVLIDMPLIHNREPEPV